MTRQVLLGLLQQGNTGNEILSILDVIVAGVDDNQPSESDASELEF